MVAGTGIEPACVAYETTEEPLLNPASNWSGRRDFNPRSPVPETGALSTRPLPENLGRGAVNRTPMSRSQAVGVPLCYTPKTWSGWRESDPRLRFGRPKLYH